MCFVQLKIAKIMNYILQRYFLLAHMLTVTIYKLIYMIEGFIRPIFESYQIL